MLPKPKTPGDESSEWKLESRELVLKNRWHHYLHDHGKKPDGSDFDYYYIDVRYSCAVVALTKDRQLIMVNQYRYPTNKWTWEVPGGGGEAELSPEKLIAKELLEETGYQAGSWEFLNLIDVMNGYSSDQSYVFLARDCFKVGDQQLEASEQGMNVVLFSVEEVYQKIANGEIVDSFTLAALMIAQKHIL